MKGEYMKILTLLFTVMIGSVMASDVYIYNYDFEDLVYDPVVGDSIDTGYWVEQLLIANGDNVDSGADLPSDLSSYDVVFMMMGMYRC